MIAPFYVLLSKKNKRAPVTFAQSSAWHWLFITHMRFIHHKINRQHTSDLIAYYVTSVQANEYILKNDNMINLQ